MKGFIQLNEEANREHLRVSKLNRQSHPRYKGSPLQGYRGKVLLEFAVFGRKILILFQSKKFQLKR